MIDFNSIPNPYDFAGPVLDERLFIGREPEMDEIKYYLELAKTAQRPINIALLGARASGKTSILNMTEIEAKKRDFCVVRVNLDEGDVQTELRFFLKLFDSVLTGACETGALGGIAGKTYDTYIELITTCKMPPDPEHKFTPFLFPVYYARAMSAGNLAVPLLDFGYARDLAKITEFVGRPIVILFDEGNVLAKSRVHLEKLRNIFMNLRRYMIVLTGTPDLFPIMDEVFSPMIRQFKKIVVAEFKSENEIRLCVERPLRRIGLSTTDIRTIVSPATIFAIKELSGGRPYEVQLVCHVLFRRLQTKRAAKMSLDVAALDEVRKELETSQSLAERPVLNRVRTLNQRELTALACALSGVGLTFDELWSLEYLVAGDSRWTKERLREYLDSFATRDILAIDDKGIRFLGDDFEKIYTRYLVWERGIKRYGFEIVGPGGRANVEVWVTVALMQQTGLSALTMGNAGSTLRDLEGILGMLCEENHDGDVFVEYPDSAEELYFLMLRHRDAEAITVLELSVTLPVCKASDLYWSDDQSGTGIDAAITKLRPLQDRCRALGGSLEISPRELVVPRVDCMIRKVGSTANQVVRSRILDRHQIYMQRAYLQQHKVDEALFHADSMYENLRHLSPSACNNIGYLFLAAGRLDRARECFNKAAKRHENSVDKTEGKIRAALPLYNLAIVEARSEQINRAIPLLETSIARLESAEDGDRELACLFVPEIEESKITWVEKRDDVDLLQTAKSALANLKKALQ
jgi:tetratricopeptide (TPR) repeat protein